MRGMEEGARTRELKGERNWGLGYWVYRDKRWPKCSSYSCPKAMVCLNLVPKLLSPKRLGTWKGRSASRCLLGKLSSLLPLEGVELSSLQHDP